MQAALMVRSGTHVGEAKVPAGNREPHEVVIRPVVMVRVQIVTAVGGCPQALGARLPVKPDAVPHTCHQPHMVSFEQHDGLH